MEEYKEIKGYEGLYEVSNLGNVKRLRKTVVINGNTRTYYQKILSGTLDSNGFLKVVLSKGGKSSGKRVHKLVVEAFLDNGYCGRGRLIKHLDGDRTNNKLDNLELTS